MMGAKCKHCDSRNTVRAGVHISGKGRFQRWKCKDCGRISIKGKIKLVDVGKRKRRRSRQQ